LDIAAHHTCRAARRPCRAAICFALRLAAPRRAAKLCFAVSQEESRERLCLDRLLQSSTMFQISRRTPAYYFTSVTHKRLPIFRTDKLKQVLCDAYREACDRHGILMLAYVIMVDHTHLLVRAEREMDEVLRLLNGVAAKRIIDYLKDNGFEESLFKLRGEIKERNHRHSVWQHHPDSLEIFSEDTFKQKCEYIHMNPVRAGFVDKPLAYHFSSARHWANQALDEEPLRTDHQLIDWR